MSGVDDRLTIIVGPAGHGVVEHALVVADAGGGRRMQVARPEAITSQGGGVGAGVNHLHYTDALFGPTTDEAARVFVHLAGSLGGRVVVTLHDVPLGDDARDRRRAAAYRAVAATADGLIVASGHEAAHARRAGVTAPLTVIPLPVIERAVSPPLAGDCPTLSVGVLGYVYPGKGHAEVLAAAATLPADVGVVAGGRASDGHEDLAVTLATAAARRGRSFTVTGWLDEPALIRFLGSTTVPVVAAPAASASASLNTWIGAGRRPIVVATDYTVEYAARAAALVHLVPSGQLASAMAAALSDPERTWCTSPVPEALTLAAVAARHDRVLGDALSGRQAC